MFLRVLDLFLSEMVEELLGRFFRFDVLCFFPMKTLLDLRIFYGILWFFSLIFTSTIHEISSFVLPSLFDLRKNFLAVSPLFFFTF